MSCYTTVLAIVSVVLACLALALIITTIILLILVDNPINTTRKTNDSCPRKSTDMYTSAFYYCESNTTPTSDELYLYKESNRNSSH
ncbi:hypothetical protein CHUAL_007022 [Chamberlinius hualienensis]